MYKSPKGTIDYYGKNASKLKLVINQIENVFVSHGAQFLDTPTFERRDVLMEKYGEESKLIYEIDDKDGGEKLALKYDQTIPFIRFLIENKINKIKRYSISKVYRRDNPNISQGRYREFYQADFDIVGESNENMNSEILIFSAIDEILSKLGLSNYIIKVNDTNNLRKMLVGNIGITDVNFKKVCSTIDKLDKQDFNELVDEFKSKGLTDDQINQLDKALKSNEFFCETFRKNLEKITKISNGKIEYSVSLARGLDYYNGIIFEVKIDGFVSSIIAGGRYDMKTPIDNTMIGFSVGISRLLQFIELETGWREEYYLTTLGNVSDEDKFKVLKFCKNNVSKDKPLSFNLTKDKKLGKVITETITNNVRYLIIIAENELKDRTIMIKDLKESSQKNILLF